MATLKQKKAVQKVAENGGNVSKGMIAAGYSPATAKTPQKLTESKGWLELMERYLPDETLAEKHLELLNKREVVKTFVDGEAEYEFIDQPDTAAVSKALDMAYKLKGSYAPEKQDRKLSFEALTPEQQQALNTLMLPNVDQTSPEQNDNGDDSGTPVPQQ